MKNYIRIFIFKFIKADYLSELLRSFPCKFKIFYGIKSNGLLKVKILHSIFHDTSPTCLFS